MNRLISEVNEGNKLLKVKLPHPYTTTKKYNLYLFDDFTYIDGQYLNASPSCYNYILTNMLDIVDTNPDEKLYISKAGCAGILRRKREHNSRMNPRLEKVLENCSV